MSLAEPDELPHTCGVGVLGCLCQRGGYETSEGGQHPRGRCRHVVLVLRMIRRRRNSHPAGTTRAAYESFPMRDRSSRLVVDRLEDQWSSSQSSSPSFSAGSRISCCDESSCRPKKVRTVVGPSTFSITTCTPSWAATLRKSCKWPAHVGSPGGPAIK